MAYTIDLTDKEITVLNKLRKVEKDGKLLRRYQCIWFAHEKYPKKEIAKMLAVNIDTVTDWIKLFIKNRFNGLSTFHYDGRRPSSLDLVKDSLLKHIKDVPVSKLSELQQYLKADHGIDIEHSWLSRYLKKNSIVLIKRQD